MLITILILDAWFNMPVYLYLIGALIYCLLLFYGSYHVGSNFFVKVICSADTPQRVVAISFDDGPLDNYPPQVLQVLKEHRVPAAFFCIGRNI
ncbi:MAG: polysaccharide deacetylase family protein, partial [Flavitalea sp.]